MEFELYELKSQQGDIEYCLDDEKEISRRVLGDTYEIIKIAYIVWDEELAEYIGKKEYKREEIIIKICDALTLKLKLPKTLHKITSYNIDSEKYYYLISMDSDEYYTYEDIQELAEEHYDGNVDEALDDEMYVLDEEQIYIIEKEKFFQKIDDENCDIEEVQYQTYAMCKNALENDYDALHYVMYQTEELCKIAVEQNGLALQHIKNKTQELCKIAVKQNSFALAYVENQTEEICKIALEEYGMTLKYVKNQNEELCKIAVGKNGYMLEYIENQTEELCKIAVSKSPYSLQYVKEQTVEICKIAIQKDKEVIKYVDERLKKYL